MSQSVPIESVFSESMLESSNRVSSRPHVTSPNAYGVNIREEDIIQRLEKYSIEDIVELKISRFLDQVGTNQIEDIHNLIISKVEKPLIVQVLRHVGGNQVQASKILGINRNTLRKKMKTYGIF